MLQYHSAICEILGIPPVVSPQRLDVLAEREHLCCTEWPASVIEWFAIADAEIWFHRHTNHDHLVHIQELGDYEQNVQGWLHVAWENQGVVLWYCKLDGTDDPPVWHDDNCYGDVPFAQIPWGQESLSFSGFIFDSLAQSHYGSWYKGLHIDATSPSFPDTMRGTLQSHFKPGPFTEQGQQKVYRFYNEHTLISVAIGKLSEKVKWTIHPVSQQALREVLSVLKPALTWLESWETKGHREWSTQLGEYLPTLAGQRVLDEYRNSGEIPDN